jgi:hypothetical protein
MHKDDVFRIETVEDTFEFEAYYGTAVCLSDRSVRVGGPHCASYPIPKRSNLYPETRNRAKGVGVLALGLGVMPTRSCVPPYTA